MKTKMLITAALIAAVAGTTVSTAVSAEGSRGRGMMQAFDFSAADTDQSGGLTREEFGAYLQTLQSAVQARREAALLEAGDADGDGTLSAEERQAAMASLREGARERMGHGAGEGREGRMRGHGEEQGAERQGRRQAQGAEGGEQGERQGRRQAQGAEGGDEQGGDRRQRGLARMFERIDANGDDLIDAEELAQAMTRMQERMGERRSNG